MSIVDEGGRCLRHPVTVSPVELRMEGVKEARVRHHSAHRTVSPQEVRRATRAMLDSQAGNNADSPDTNLTI